MSAETGRELAVSFCAGSESDGEGLRAKRMLAVSAACGEGAVEAFCAHTETVVRRRARAPAMALAANAPLDGLDGEKRADSGGADFMLLTPR